MDFKTILTIVFFIITPVIIIYLEKNHLIVRKVGSVLICYGIGLLLGNIGVLPEGIEKYQELITNITIPLALPLILFSLNVKKWVRMARETFISLIIGLATVTLMVIVGFLIFGDNINDSWKVSGMLMGVYTGGTPNLAAMKTALNVPQELYIMTHTYDMFLSAIYLIFVLSIGQKVFLWFLPPFKKSEKVTSASSSDIDSEFNSYNNILSKNVFLPLLVALAISIAILAASYGLSFLFPADFQTAAIILSITTLGIALSFNKKVNNIKKTFQGGMYIILVFCIVVASMADISKLSNISFSLFWYISFAMFGSHILHAFIAKFFKIDADTVIISGSALICSPPFVPVVAAALKNREIVLTGMIVGIAGYAIGNYLGVLIAFLLK